jgi:hypothetical protein
VFIEKKPPSVPPVPLETIAGEFETRPVAARDLEVRDLEPPPLPTAPAAPARAQRYRTGETERRLRAATAAAGAPGPTLDAVWILFAAAIALGVGVTSLLLVGYA